MLRFTDRMQRIIKEADNLALSNVGQVVTPGHLLYACLNEKTGALGEIRLKISLDLNVLKSVVSNTENFSYSPSRYFNSMISEEAARIFDVAKTHMNHYNQIYLNEDHLLKALLKSGTVDYLITDEDKQMIITLGTTSRDMITHLKDYTFPVTPTETIQKVSKKDENLLTDFIENHFPNWLHTVQQAFLSNKQNIYIACNDADEIIGFACYDTYQNKKGYFGPMGVAEDCRIKGIGSSLLHHCLRDMKEIGYEYAIIGGAGPLEFYEKTCGAVVIPMMEGTRCKKTS
ncbi:Clp amino terminal domain-containing protein, pathogenicity island component [Gracilibacillus ureilyticus]|uniref:Clp amino terminal domain-containing protein, pathogenicity island component n=1 Tax=Gracilibacillus ureilyticus TaxID=531814 RepID=A0A1H9VUX0_9BACI|nr:GNAT family N-acetyltransferase [Gracilibacillus ureilyticus]SES25331.1 Clp amino terminal domain-containing protein, pathogenicity island component [Gracilibacillus ureilyticus]